MPCFNQGKGTKEAVIAILGVYKRYNFRYNEYCH